MIFCWGLLTWTFVCLWWINCTSSARPSTLVGEVTRRERGEGRGEGVRGGERREGRKEDGGDYACLNLQVATTFHL